MAYYDALIAEWPNLTGTTEQKLTAINTMTVAQPQQPVAIADIMVYLRSNNLWLPIKAAAGTNQGAAAAVDIVGDLRASTIDFTLAITQTLLGMLVSSNLLSQQNADDLKAMGNNTLPWWKVNGYPGIFNENDLIAAGNLT